jgi:Uma2 family endonuclease
MSGAGKQHNRINRNLVIEIGQYLKGRRCNVYTNEMRVSTPSHTTYMYPDVLIYCGEDLYEDDEFDTLLNPAVIFEILSPSTQRFDKGRKFHFYQEIPPFKEYFMIDSKKRIIYVYRKQIDNSWKLETIDKKTISLFIETIDFTLPLDEIYRDTGL